jgi:hypothetical protein
MQQADFDALVTSFLSCADRAPASTASEVIDTLHALALSGELRDFAWTVTARGGNDDVASRTSLYEAVWLAIDHCIAMER